MAFKKATFGISKLFGVYTIIIAVVVFTYLIFKSTRPTKINFGHPRYTFFIIHPHLFHSTSTSGKSLLLPQLFSLVSSRARWRCSETQSSRGGADVVRPRPRVMLPRIARPSNIDKIRPLRWGRRAAPEAATKRGGAARPPQDMLVECRLFVVSVAAALLPT
jgi:hypothetical protein